LIVFTWKSAAIRNCPEKKKSRAVFLKLDNRGEARLELTILPVKWIAQIPPQFFSRRNWCKTTC
jgi:hypothetical protein